MSKILQSIYILDGLVQHVSSILQNRSQWGNNLSGDA
jgi:hypothetical protein